MGYFSTRFVKPASERYGRLLARYLWPQGRQVGLLAVLLLSSIALQLVNPQILRNFIDSAQAGSSLGILTQIALVFLGAALVGQVFSVAANYLGESVGWTATNHLRQDLALHCLQLDMSFHNARNPGELIERIDGDVTTLGSFFSRLVIQVFGSALLLIGSLVLLFQIHWIVGMSLSVFALAALLMVGVLRNLAVPHWAAAREASASLFGFLEERLSGTEDIRSSGATAFVMRGLAHRSRMLLRQQRWAGLMGMTTGSAAIILFAVGNAVAFVVGAYLFRAGTITIGTVYLIFNYTELLRQPIEQLTRQMQDLQQASASIGRIQELFGIQSTIIDVQAQQLPDDMLTVEMEHVSFGYAAGDLVLDDVSFSLRPGMVLGLLGRTGSGKTTLIRLLFRLYDPNAGTIRLGNVDLRDVPIADLRNKIGMVTQDIQLFYASVRDNLTFFDRNIPDERIMVVLDDLGLMGWYRSLPAGLDTKLAPGGSGLSAGEAQLLAFVRVFLKDPGLVILDEASSRLDPATERLVEHAVDRLLEGRTGIIIAHRLQTVERVDEIMVLQRGRVIEYGSRAALVEDKESRFAQMLRTGLEEMLV